VAKVGMLTRRSLVEERVILTANTSAKHTPVLHMFVTVGLHIVLLAVINFVFLIIYMI